MRIYSKVVIDIATGRVVESVGEEYAGPVALLKGGTSGTSTTISGSPTASGLATLGAGFLAPAFGSQLTGVTTNKQGISTPKFSPPTISFDPLTGIRDQTWGRLQPVIPLLEQQVGQVGALPGMVSGFNEPRFGDTSLGTGLAVRNAMDVFDPMRNQGVFDTAANRLLGQIRPGLGARGLAMSGVGQAAENEALQQLALGFADREQQYRNQAIGSLESTLGGDLSRRLQQSGGILSAITGGQGAIARGYQLPLDVLSQATQLELAPLQALIGLTGAAAGGSQISTTNQQQRVGGSGLFGAK